MKFPQLIECIKKIFSFKNHAENETGRIILDPFFKKKKTLYKVKGSVLQFGFAIFR